ncbi:MAG: DegV family protein [Bacilli bacterium]
MSEYILSACSSIDISPSKVKELDLRILPFQYTLGENQYMDDFFVSRSSEEFYGDMAKGMMTHTSQNSVGEYMAFFEPFLKEGKDILHVLLSSGLSGTYQSAKAAVDMLKEFYPERRILLVDSLDASVGEGLLVAELAKEKKEGKSLDELYESALAIRNKQHLVFFPSTLKYLVRGGRVSKTAGAIGNAFHIVPLMRIDKDGKLLVIQKCISSHIASHQLVKRVVQYARGGADYDGTIFLGQGDDLRMAEKMTSLIEKEMPKAKVEVFSVGPTIGAHTGPGTILVGFWGEADKD